MGNKLYRCLTYWIPNLINEKYESDVDKLLKDYKPLYPEDDLHLYDYMDLYTESMDYYEEEIR